MRRLLLLPVLSLVGVMFVASPASAATVDLTVDETTITAGDSVTLGWDVTVAFGSTATVTASSTVPAGAPPTTFTGPRDVESPEGGESVTLSTPGVYTFTLTAQEPEVEIDGTDTVTVEVLPADEDLTEIPVPEITFPDPCTIVLPDVENVEYGVGFGQSGSSLEAGEYDLADFYNFGAESTFGVNPAEGFTFPEGAETTFPIVVSQDCFPQLVETEAICQGVTFTNTTDGTLIVQYGDIAEETPDEEFELAAGQARTVSTERDLVFFLSAVDIEDFDQAGFVEVEQDCTPASAGAAFPTVAPAAGSDGGSAAGLGALVAMTLAGGAALGARRLRRTA